MAAPQIDNFSTLAWARFYASSGFRVFPVGTDKKPLVKWKSEATSDLQTVTKWFQFDFQGAAIGLCTGAVGARSGVVVIDCDNIEAYRFFRSHFGPISQSLTSQTGRGYHVFYRYDVTKNNKHFCNGTDIAKGSPPGMDVRGAGGYVIAPPSLHANGNRYTWITPSFDWRDMLSIPLAWDKERESARIFGDIPNKTQQPVELPETAKKAVEMVQRVFTPEEGFRRQKYAKNAINGKLEDIRNAARGSRHDTAIRRAIHALRLALDPCLDIDPRSVCDGIYNACLCCGLPKNESKQIVMDSLKYARKEGSFTQSEWDQRVF